MGRVIYVLLAAWMLLLIGCSKRYGRDESAEGVSFSVDTVRFDTVMHSRVSSIRRVSLRNRSNQPVWLKRIWLEGSRSDAFHVVVDGVRLCDFTGATIPRNDSLVFVLSQYTEEYTADVFEQLDVCVEVVVASDTLSLPVRGWNAGWSELQHAISSDVVIPKGGIRYVEQQAEVQNTATLIIEPGATLIFGDGARLLVWGRLVARGAVDARVSFLPQRMEPYYMRKPGQWTGVVVEAGSRGVELLHTDVRCAVVGLQVKGKPNKETVSLENCRILYSSLDGVQLSGGVEATVKGSILGQNYRHGVALVGAKADLTHCTVCVESMPPHSQLGEGLWLDDGDGKAEITLFNSILWGDRVSEVGVRGQVKGVGRMFASHSVLKILEENLRDAQYFDGCTVGDPRLELRAQGV